ncbi:pectate lyase [bacterium]|nr:pectate lyase [bacterium]MDB4394153.1 pectate lyase [Rhodopirellula sp.]
MEKAILIAAIFVLGSLTSKAGTRECLKQPDAWFSSRMGRVHLDNLLTYQDGEGCWPKNVDTTSKVFEGNAKDLNGTFDNGATVNELRLLARGFNITHQQRYQTAFLRGIHCILDTQYPNGGWPQAPNPSGYQKHITFNDGTMIGLMTFLRDVFTAKEYHFVSSALRQRAKKAFQGAVQCILACQIKVNGTLTAWCAQHDHKTLVPRGARSYEHPSISGHESAGVTILLMSIKKPTKSIQASVNSAVQWLRDSQLNGISVQKTSDGDKQVVSTSKSEPLWARFYEIETNRPMFSGRDGVIQYQLANIEAERRNGYSWYVNTGRRVFDQWQEWARR